MTRVARSLIVVATIAAFGACGGEKAVAPVAGALNVRLRSPNSGQDSAIVFTITGPTALVSATVAPGFRLFHQPLGNAATSFAVTGQLQTNAIILTIEVVDVNREKQYSGVILGVAQPNYELRPLTGYSLAVTRN